MEPYTKINWLIADLRHADGDIRIEFGFASPEHAQIHSSLLAKHCPRFNVNQAQPDSQGIRVFAVCFQNATCVLEPLTTRSVLSTDAICQRFHDSSLAPEGWSTTRELGSYKGQAARIQNLYAKREYICIIKILYGQAVSLEDLEPWRKFQEPIHKLHAITTSLIETCARAEALGCLNKVAAVLVNTMLQNEVLGQCVAETPVKFLKLATKVGCKQLYIMATRHIAPDSKFSKGWFDYLIYGDINKPGLQTEIEAIFGEESQIVNALVDTFARIQACTEHMIGQASTQPHHVRTPTTKSNFCAQCIARTHFAEWLAAELDVCSHSVSDMQTKDLPANKPNFEKTLHRLQHFAQTAMPFQVFGNSSNAHKSLAAELGLRGYMEIEKEIKYYLDTCVNQAASAINRAFTKSSTELNDENFPTLGAAMISVPRSKQNASTQRIPEESASPRPSSVVSMSSDESSHTIRASQQTATSATIARSQPTHAAIICAPTSAPYQSQADPALPPTSLIDSDNYTSCLEELFQRDGRWLQLYFDLAENWERIDETGEDLLPQDLVRELDQPSHERWRAEMSQYHRCCGARKAEEGGSGTHGCQN